VNAVPALGYLLRRTMRNRLVRQRKRLRSPVAAIGLILGLAYLGLVLWNPSGTAMFSARPFGGAGVELAAVMLLVFIGRWWLVGAERQALTFTPAEIHFLFPAPLTRRTILAYRLTKKQLLLLVNAAIWTWLFQGTGLPAGARFLAFWVLFGTLHMHMLGASLVRAGMLEHGRSGLRRHRIAITLLFGVLAALLWSIAQQYESIVAAQGALPTLRAAGEALQSGPAQVALAPLRLLIQPALARSTIDWAFGMPLALAVAALHLIWVLQADIAFEEAAIEASARHARRLESVRQGRGPAPSPQGSVRTRLTLPAWGHPAIAILWKNAIAMIRGAHGAAILRIAAIVLTILAFSTVAGDGDFMQLMGVTLATWAGLLVVAGPLWIRFDFRRDLARLDTLRALPISATSVAAAEIAGSALAITALQLVMVALAAATVEYGGTGTQLPPPQTIALFLAAALPLNAIIVGVHNVHALSSPDAGRRSQGRAAGIEAFGVHLLIMLVSVLAVLVALIAPALAAGLAWNGLRPVSPGLGMIAAGMLAIATLAAEAWWVVIWVGRVFARGES
jgi:hypothetical protein